MASMAGSKGGIYDKTKEDIMKLRKKKDLIVTFINDLTTEIKSSPEETGFYISSLKNVLEKTKKEKDLGRIEEYLQEKVKSLTAEGSAAIRMWAGSGATVGGNSMASNYREYYGTQIQGFTKALEFLRKYLSTERR